MYFTKNTWYKLINTYSVKFSNYFSFSDNIKVTVSFTLVQNKLEELNMQVWYQMSFYDIRSSVLF